MREIDLDYYTTLLLCKEIKPIIVHNNPEDYGLTQDDVFKIKIINLKVKKTELEREVQDRCARLLRNDGWIKDLLYEQWAEAQKQLRKTCVFLNYLQRLEGDWESANESFDLERIKKVPMDQLTEILPSGFFVHNPFRNEASPSNSLHWYKAKNTWTDFGTGEHGSNIDLVMKLHSCGFQEACRILSKF